MGVRVYLDNCRRVYKTIIIFCFVRFRFLLNVAAYERPAAVETETHKHTQLEHHRICSLYGYYLYSSHNENMLNCFRLNFNFIPDTTDWKFIKYFNLFFPNVIILISKLRISLFWHWINSVELLGDQTDFHTNWKRSFFLLNDMNLFVK